jgi:DNA-binding CsgD family transcriptional regulator
MANGVTLSPREREVLTLIAQRLTSRKIAQQLGITPNTVAGIVTSAMSKLGAENRCEAVRLATQQGLIP